MSKRIYNPPFPHRCRIIRKNRTVAMVDEPDVDGFGDSGGDVYDPFADDSDDDGGVNGQDGENGQEKAADSSTGEDSDGFGITDVNDLPEGVTLVYDGACMVCPKHTTSDSGDVITSLRGLALPITSNCWEELGMIPRKNDEVYAWRGLQREYGQIKDVDAANFGGTEIIWRVDGN